MTRLRRSGGVWNDLDGGATPTYTLDQLVPHIVHEMNAGGTSGAPTLVTLPMGASANTKPTGGSEWTVLVSSLPVDADFAVITANLTGASGVAGAVLCDISVGNSGFEASHIIAANLQLGGAGSLANAKAMRVVVPVPFASGVRVSARAQYARSTGTAGELTMQFFKFPAGLAVDLPDHIDTLLANTATSSGTLLTTTAPFAVATASAPVAYQGFIAVPCSVDTAMGAVHQTLEVGIGANGAEVWMNAGDNWGNDAAEAVYATMSAVLPCYYPMPCNIGDRVAVKLRSTAQPTNNLAVCVYGVPYP